MSPMGKTDLIGEKNVSKADLRINLIGVLDEASAALSLAKAFCSSDNQLTIETCQKELSQLMGVLAALPTTDPKKLIDVFLPEVTRLESSIKELENRITYPGEFIHPGQNPATGALDLARTVVRRAERVLVAGFERLQIQDGSIPQYLNRLSTLCYLLILAETPA